MERPQCTERFVMVWLSSEEKMSQLGVCLAILFPSPVTPIVLPLNFSSLFLSSFSFLIRDPI